MKHLLLLLSILCFHTPLYAQQTASDTAVIKIPPAATVSPTAMGKWLKANASNDYDAVKSLYYWIANNIRYDVTLASADKPYKDTIDAAIKTLTTHAGTCQGYTCLFFEVCRQANIPVDLITGYTYVQGQLSTDGSHGWLGVQLNGQWGIIDPTWGAGAVDDSDVFRFSFTWEQFMISPEKAIYTHVPFDPIFQYLSHPVKPDELRDHTWETAANRPAINFEDSIAAYKKQTALEQVKSRMRRMEAYGVINQLQRDEVSFLQKSIPAAAYSTDVASGADARFRTAISQYNKLVTLISNKKSWGGTEFLIWSDYRIKECQDILAAANAIRLTFDVNEQNRLNFVKTVNKTLAHLQKGRKDFVEVLKKNR
ncbi:Transglutaminase-like superfamily protein [Chitinophaga jiangningensis]|uniref:Transglutaminase-like superfamily protein n=1 Tax=Chitinophaga jiangningensis TaxID=1419482 RepID=A0A1M7FWU5_9BACT|nr:transglutaminase domain-containing protein [Chitinophaga jiangningensis]SHM08503.1 Transglutaminase-like superfamily protein [Chitinophaga jiangningensis]